MKVIVVGGTGFVGREVIRQSLAHPSITSVISLGRRTTSAPDDAANAGKLTSVTCDDFTNYSESVKSALAGADACIWLLAVTPSKSMSMPKAEVRKICYDYTVTGLQTMAAQRKGAFRFIYTSGVAATADPAKKPWLMGDYSLMRGQVEEKVFSIAEETKVDACVMKPGLIGDKRNPPGMLASMGAAVRKMLISLPTVDVSQIAATAVKQAVDGVDKKVLLNEDLIRIGDEALNAK